jgi:hypothetical protein
MFNDFPLPVAEDISYPVNKIFLGIPQIPDPLNPYLTMPPLEIHQVS